jgi:hypothetical protein
VREGEAVWPNPATSQVTVSLPSALPKPAVWSLCDPLGREVRRAVLSAGRQRVEVSVEGVAAGLYFWRVASKEAMLGNGKLIISK